MIGALCFAEPETNVSLQHVPGNGPQAFFLCSAVMDVFEEFLNSSRSSGLGMHDSEDTLSCFGARIKTVLTFTPSLSACMQTPNHSIISELLKSINAAAELCNTKLPDQTNVNFQAPIGKSLTPKFPDNLQEKDDSMKQDPKSKINESLQKADLSENVDRIHRKRRVVALNSLDDS